MPNSTTVMVLHFVHTLPAVTKKAHTELMQEFCNFTCIFETVNLASKYKPAFWLPVNIKIVSYSWGFINCWLVRVSLFIDLGFP